MSRLNFALNLLSLLHNRHCHYLPLCHLLLFWPDFERLLFLFPLLLSLVPYFIPRWLRRVDGSPISLIIEGIEGCKVGAIGLVLVAVDTGDGEELVRQKLMEPELILRGLL